MYKIEIRHEDNNGREYGYGIYVNAYVTWDDTGGIPVRYASECVPRDNINAETLKAAEKRVRAKAHRAAKKEYRDEIGHRRS